MKRGPYIPPLELLETAASSEYWDLAIKQAMRSPMIRFRAGAVIFDNEGVVATGCSSPDLGSDNEVCSMHAERHALKRASKEGSIGAWIAIYTMNGSGGCAWSSRPCLSCAKMLYSRGIERIIYPQRLEDNTWTIISEHPEELLERAINLTVSGRYARGQRIP